MQRKIPKLSINNFTTSWIDGFAIIALIESIAPGLCIVRCNENPLTFLGDAMELADEWLDIQMFVKPHEFGADCISERAIITYVGQFPPAKLRSGAPLRARRISNRCDIKHYFEDQTD